MSHSWRAGMKAVCVDASHPGIPGWPLARGRIYDIEAISIDMAYYHGEPAGEQVLLELAGIRNPCPATHGFLASRFRPLRKGEADIAVFRNMLNAVEETVPA